MEPLIQEHEVVLFQGDSITDWGRNYQDGNDLGKGYALQTAAWFSALYPERRVRFINRGISGNRAVDLRGRWDQDCIALKPTTVSIMIGINHCWRRYDNNDPTSPGQFEENYREILSRIRKELGAKLIICEPFVLPFPEERKQWREDLDPKIQVVRKLATEFHAVYVPLDGLFAQAAMRTDPAFWTLDGVHPTEAGAALIARAWLQAVQAL